MQGLVFVYANTGETLSMSWSFYRKISWPTHRFNNKDGQPAAFIEPIPSNYDKKLIRSPNCSLFLPIGGACLRCESCFRTDHYMRTVKSWSKNTYNNNTVSKFTRYDYMTKDQLVEHSRRTAETLCGLQVRLRRLQEHQESMTTDSETDSDFKKCSQSSTVALKTFQTNTLILFAVGKIVRLDENLCQLNNSWTI